MFKIVFFLLMSLFLLFVSERTYSQKEKYNQVIDSITYKLYLKNDLDKLKEITYNAIDEGIDFYYLRMRIGILEYLGEKYFSAINNFKKALYFKSRDMIAMEYLFYAYLYTGRKSDAELIYESFTDSLKNKIKYKIPGLFERVQSEIGFAYNGNYDNFTNSDINAEDDVYGEQKLLKKYTYANFGLFHNINSRIKFFQNFTTFAYDYNYQIQDFMNVKKDFNIHSMQYDYYLNAYLNLGDGYDVSAGFRYMYVNFENIRYYYNSVNPEYRNVKNHLNNYVGVINLGKYVDNLRLDISFSFSNINMEHQIQNRGAVTFYPKSNLDIYFYTELILHSSKPDSNKSLSNFSSNLIFNEKVGFSLSEKFFVEGFFTYGNIRNYNKDLAYTVYNNVENIKRIFGLSLTYFTGQKTQIYLLYQNFLSEHKILTYKSDLTNYIQNQNIFYNYIIGGFKWNI